MSPFVAESLFHIKCRNCEKYGFFNHYRLLRILQRNGLTISGIKSLCCHFKVLKRGAPSVWSTSLYCPLRNSDRMTITQTHSTLLDLRQIQKGINLKLYPFATRMHSKMVAANYIPDMHLTDVHFCVSNYFFNSINGI